MDIWKELIERARELYHPEDITPFITVSHVVCALEAENGEIYTGVNIESCCGVMDLCAERVAALKMLTESGQTVVRRLVAFRDRPPYGGGSGQPCGACREFFMQLDERNEDMVILTDYTRRETVRLKELIPDWWGRERYEKLKSISLIPAERKDLHTVLQMQIEAFADMLSKYEDYDTSPANEKITDILRRFRQDGSTYYFITTGSEKVGVIRVVDPRNGAKKKISPLFILPEYRRQGYAQKAIEEVERIYGEQAWQLSTILQEDANCHLYEKFGYRRTGLKEVNDKMTLVFYEKD